ncbi:MAG: hypothetical protein K8T25_08500 [Planctomycetia bacterium]|nr:hypothetical protein [Planctomycetia bacterium]
MIELIHLSFALAVVTRLPLSHMMQVPKLPSGESLPLQYRWWRANGISQLGPWIFIDDEKWRESVRESIHKDSQGVDCWPFASHSGRDEVAAFALSNGATNGSVVIFDRDIFDNQTPGALESFPDFWTWFVKSAIAEAHDIVTAATEDDLVRWFGKS